MTEQFANDAQGVLSAPITAGQTTISITPTDYTGRPANKSNFPLLGNFRLTVQSFDVTTQIPTSAPEIMLVTAVAGNTFTVQRGAENSTASAFASGAQVVHGVTAAVMTALEAGGGGGGVSRSISSISSNTTAGSSPNTDYVYFCTGTFNFTMPPPLGNTNRYTLANSGTGTITFLGSINGNQPLYQQYQSYDFVSDGNNWNII